MPKTKNTFFKFLNPNLLACIIAVPLITIPGQRYLSTIIQSVFLILLSVLALSTSHYNQAFKKNLRSLPKPVIAVTLLFFILIIVGSILSAAPLYTVILGYLGDNQGVFVWLAYLALAITVAKEALQVDKNPYVPHILGAILVLSILFSISSALNEGRIQGIAFHATNMGIIATLAIVDSLYKLLHTRKRPYPYIAYITMGTLVLMLTQSRISVLICLLCVFALILHKFTNWKVAVTLSLMVIMSSFAVGFSGNLGDRFTPQSIAYGVSYRAELYTHSLQKLSQAPIYGLGASSAKDILSIKDTGTPKFITRTLNSGFEFWYAHNILIDFSLLFGVFAGLGLLYLVVLAIISVLRRPDLSAYFFIVLAANALVNTPSLYLTSLFFIFLYSRLIPIDKNKFKDKLMLKVTKNKKAKNETIKNKSVRAH